MQFYYPEYGFHCQNCGAHNAEPEIPVEMTVQEFKEQTFCFSCKQPWVKVKIENSPKSWENLNTHTEIHEHGQD